MKVGIILSAIMWAILAVWLQGCAALVGIKEYKGSDGSVIKFTTGFDIGASATAVDSLDNRKGINAKELR